MKHLFSLFFASLISCIGIAQCEDFTLTIDYTHPLCPGFSDGSVSPSVSGGLAPFHVEISDADGALLGFEGFYLVEGWYFVYVIDDAGCELYDSVELKDPLPMVIDDLTLVDPTAFEICDGSITINDVSGDYESIYYFWSPDPDGVSGLEANALTGACAGSYTLTLNNEIGCSVVIEDLVIGEGLGIGEKALEDVVTISQNGNQITFNNSSTNSAISFKLIDLNGREINQEKIGTGQFSKEFNVVPGMYLLLLVDNKGNALTRKIVFQ